MLCVWLENNELSLKHVDTPNNSEGQVLLKVLRAGICNTDLELIKGYYPYTGILGHECLCVVIDGPADLMGRRVTVEINFACGICCWCAKACKNHCLNRTVMGIVNQSGCFAEYVVAPTANVIAVPDNVPDAVAVFAEPLAAALEIQEQIAIKDADRVVVIGDGKLGILIALSLRAKTKAQLSIIGHHKDKLDLITDQFPDVTTHEGIPDNLVGTFDVAVECTGNDSAFADAVKLLRPRGTLVMKSTYAGPLTTRAAPIVVQELTLIGSRCGPMQKAMDLLASGVIDVLPLLQKEMPLVDALAAFELAKQKGSLKIQLIT